MTKKNENKISNFIRNMFILEILWMAIKLVDHYFLGDENYFLTKYLGIFAIIFSIFFFCSMIFILLHWILIKKMSSSFYKTSLLTSFLGLFAILLFAFFVASQLH